MTADAVVPFPTPFEALSNREVETGLLGIAGHIAAAQCRFLQYLGEFDARLLWVGDGIRSCAHWMSWKVGMNIRTANEHLRIARALRSLPLTTQAFAAGELTYSKVRAITRAIGTDSSALVRIAQQLAAGTSGLRDATVADSETAEKILLNIARHGTASWSRWCGRRGSWSPRPRIWRPAARSPGGGPKTAPSSCGPGSPPTRARP